MYEGIWVPLDGSKRAEAILPHLEQLAPKELCDSYAQGGGEPTALLGRGRTDLATRLRVEEGPKQEEAYYAADQMPAYARRQAEAENTEIE